MENFDMLEDTDRVESAPRSPGTRMLRIVPVERRVPFEAGRAHTLRRGVPRTFGEWTALVKVGSGEKDIPAESCARLRALGLVVTISGTPALTRRGRSTLGLSA
jgi:hypothetical protein